MAYFNKAFPKIFIGSGALKVTGQLNDPSNKLAAGQLALVNSKTHAILASGATKTDAPMAYLACGSYATQDNVGGLNGGRKESDKTKGINPSYVSKWWKSSPSAGTTHKIQVGYDGSNACTCPTMFEKEKTYNLQVELKGTPVLKSLHHNLYKTFSVFTGCSTPCTDVCVESAAPRLVFRSWAYQINNDPIWSKFVKAEVGKVGNALPSDAVAYVTYTNTKTDDGSVQALAAVQVAYPALTITRDSYNANTLTSVYKTIKTSGLPAAYGGTAWVAGATVYKVTRKLCMTLPLAIAANRTAVTNALASRSDIVANSILAYTDSSSNANAGTYTSTSQVTQLSNNYVTLTNGVISTATYDVLPAVSGQAFKDCPCEADEDGTGCYYLTLEAAYSDSTFSDCSWNQFDLYDPSPLLLNAQLVDESTGICGVKGLAVTTLSQAKQATGTGEELLREYIIYRAYKQDIFDENPRMREVFNDTIMSVVKRSKNYKKYFLLHNVPRFDNPSGMFNNDQYLVVVAFEEGIDTSAFETLLGTYVTSGSNGVALETK